jgi:hypothetical protein
MNNVKNRFNKEKEWQHALLHFVTGILLFETITGLLIYFLPFSVSNQVNILLHTIIGLIFIIPFTYYLARHWNIYRSMPMNHYKVTGYVLFAVSTILIVSGVILTYQGAFLTKISKIWDLIHIIGTFIFIAFLLPHIVLIMVRNYKSKWSAAIKPLIRAQWIYGIKSSIICVLFFVLVGLWTIIYKPIIWKNQFPEDYSYLYGEDRPFAPSLATTDSEGAFDPRSVGGSEGCGSTGCHEEIYKEWEVSAHRYSAMDVAFQKVQSVMGEQNGPESTRYCGGCHDPISLFSGSKNIYTSSDDLTNDMGYQEGISCIGCHAINKTDIKGNANYVLTQPNRYMYELKDGGTSKFISDFLIRSYPKYHVETLQHKLFKSPEFCAACHKQFIDEEVNNVGWVQLQNQYDKWKNSKWNHPGDATKTIECRECHMPLVEDSMEPGSGDDLDYNRTKYDGKHRSHRFLGANQFMPLAMDLPGAKEHVELTEKWLQGDIEIPEIEDKWVKGPAVPIEIIAPEKVTPGEEVNITTVLTNNKPGHDFPTGPIDIIQAWVEIIITDQNGNEVYSSGKVDKDNFIEPGSFVFKVEPVDQYGNLIDKHNLWEMVGVRFNRSMFPGFSDQAVFSFSCPSEVSAKKMKPVEERAFKFEAPKDKITQLNITAKLKYRKIDQYLINYLFGEESGITTPITVVSEDSKSIVVEAKTVDNSKNISRNKNAELQNNLAKSNATSESEKVN